MFKLGKDLLASQRRPEMDALYAVLQQSEPRISAALTTRVEDLFRTVDEYGDLATALPYVSVRTAAKMTATRDYYAPLSEVLRRSARTLGRAQLQLREAHASDPQAKELEAALGPAAQPPEALTGLAEQIEGFGRIRDEAAVGLNLAMDLNLQMSTYGWYIAQTVIYEVLKELDDPGRSAAEKQALQIAFNDLLRYKGVLVREQAESRATRAEASAAAEADLSDAEKDEQLMAVEYAVKHGKQVDPDQLAAAADWFEERQRRAAAATAAAAKTNERKAKR